ncbi:MAG TPA: hypothetical protein VFC24_06300, partial [Casimicrobiaceae bacterium]|nr:hypothetical protein [Casimicrobiaceae bacterium]
MLDLPFWRRAMLAWLVMALGVVAPTAHASFHTYRIETVYSNADGAIQYIVLHESQGQAGQRFLATRALTSTHAGIVKTYTFPVNLPSDNTAGKRVLIATQGFADLNLIAPDYIIPNQFLATDGGSIDYAATDQLVYTSLPTDGALALTRAGTTAPNLATNFAGASVVVPLLAATSVEYYNASLDHYFISDLQPDIDALDSGRIAGWARTGQSFRVFATQSAGGATVNPVCRFYIPPAHGNSHFFSASPAECATIQAKSATDPNYSGYVYESPSAFYIALPDTSTGACPSGTAAVFRLWNQRADSNHRYTTDPGIKAQMITKAYVPEGYGPSATIMCAPTPGVASIDFMQGASTGSGALVSDASATAAANYQGYSTSGVSVVVGPRNGVGEAIAFSSRHPVALQAVAWSTAAGDQVVDVPFAAEINAPVTIWVVAAPYATGQQTALTLWTT